MLTSLALEQAHLIGKVIVNHLMLPLLVIHTKQLKYILHSEVIAAASFVLC